MNSRPLLILAFIVGAIVAAAMWFLSGTTTTVSMSPVVTTTTPSPVTGNDSTERKAATPMPRRAPATPQPAREARQEPQIAEWELKIDQILRVEATETETAQMLINMLPTLPAEGQAEAAQHITNLILDEEYNRVLPLVRNPALPEEVHDVFLTDLMNREDPVKLPTLLEIAKLPNHPLQVEAVSDLEIFLDEEFGTDWPRWEAAVQKYIADQQAEEAAAAGANPPPPVLTQ
ncbi:MAG: hypothetical protein ACO1QR_04320 [Chthoniobacteraceae bacterium]